MTASEAAKVFAILTAAYPRQTISDETAAVYARFMEDLDWRAAEEAVKRIVTTSRFFPSIAEIREEVAEATLAAPGLMLAWQQASTDVPRHRLVSKARRVVGDDWDWRTGATENLRPAFIAAYKEVRAQAVREVASGERLGLGPELAGELSA